jgi:hypothetical protein
MAALRPQVRGYNRSGPVGHVTRRVRHIDQAVPFSVTITRQADI